MAVKLLDSVRQAIRARHYSPRTGEAYVMWIRRAELRVKDIEFDRGELTVRNGKGGKDRVTMLPVALRGPLREHLVRVKAQHARDMEAGRGTVALPGALRQKYPSAPREWGWQWVLSATRFYVDRETSERRRHHLHESVLQRAVKEAVRAAGIAKPATCHSLRHSPPAGAWQIGSDRWRRSAARFVFPVTICRSAYFWRIG